jgi:hypothetical protein
MQRIPNRFRAHNILKPGISRVTVGYIIDVLGSGNLLVAGAEIDGLLRWGNVNPRLKPWLPACPSWRRLGARIGRVGQRLRQALTPASRSRLCISCRYRTDRGRSCPLSRLLCAL